MLHTFCGYLLLSEHFLSPYVKEFAAALQASNFFRVIEAVAYIIVTGTLCSKLVARLRYKNRIWFGIIKRLIGLHSILERVIVALTSFLLYVDFAENVPLLSLTAL